MEARRGKITGSKLKDIVVKRGTAEKLTYYELIADRISLTREQEDARERGHRLEPEAIEEFTKVTGKEVNTDLVIWERDDNSSIAISPDGFIDEEEAVEVKCLSSAKHIEAYLTNRTPKEYDYQILQYFIVNDNLQRLNFVMYDPNMPPQCQLKIFEIDREDLQEDVETYHKYQELKLAEIDRIVNELTF